MAASEEAFSLKVYTPAGLAVEDEVTQVTLPSSNGEIGVLPQHARYCGLLGTGVIEYFSASQKKPVRAVVTGGFSSFTDDKLSLLADEYLLAENIDKDTYATARGKLSEQLKDADSRQPETEKLNRDMKKIQAIDNLISN